MSQKYDLAIIGGGPGGYVAAIRACQKGLRVVLIEERDIGGTCLNRGCIPTKNLLHSAEVFRSAMESSKFGVTADNVTYDYAKMAERKDSVVKQLRSGVEYLVKSNGGQIERCRAFIKDKNHIEITGSSTRIIETEKIIIAAGSRPAKPQIPGIEGEKVFTSDDVLKMTDCPDRITIIGGGVIGIEFGYLFRSLGKDVTIIEMMDYILPGIDQEISEMFKKSLEKDGVKLFTGCKVNSIDSKDNVLCNFKIDDEERSVESDIVIVAVGRKPNSENLGLEELGVEVEKGFIKVDKSLSTNIEGIFAIGDITGVSLLAHVASAQGMIAAANAAGGNEEIDYKVIPGCIYTSPEIASVGLTEADALSKGYKIKKGTFPVSANGKSMIMGETSGIIKIIVDGETEEILGAHIMAPRATDMISEISVAMKLEATIEEVRETIHPHPTVSEIIMEAAEDVENECIHMFRK